MCLKEYMNYAFTNNLAVRFHAVHFRLLYSHVEKIHDLPQVKVIITYHFVIRTLGTEINKISHTNSKE